MASSLQVTKHFGKQHNNILQDLRKLIALVPDEWHTLNFQPINISTWLGHTTRQDPAYILTALTRRINKDKRQGKA